MSNPRWLTLVVILTLGLGAGSAQAQIVYGQPAEAGLDLITSHWKLAIDDNEVTIDQLAIPVSAYLPLRENVEARVYIAQASTTVSQLGRDRELSGLTDMRVQINGSLARDHLLLGLGFNLPTGEKQLSMDEGWVVMNYLSQSFLTFPVRRLGGGFGLNLLAGAAREFGDYRLGTTATLDLAGPYKAYVDQGEYEPGDTFSLTVGLQHEQAVRRIDGDLTFTACSDDRLRDKAVFSRGQQLSAHLGLAGGRPDGARYRGNAYYHLRGRNTVFDTDGILLQQLKIYGNEFLVSGSLDLGGGTAWTYGPRVEWHLIAANEYGFGRTTVAGLGGQIARKLATSIDLRLAVKYFTGSTHAGAIDLSGYQAWLAAGGTF
jgi:hypothetical protein